MGAASDRYGRKSTLILSTAFYAVCTAVSAFSHNVWFYTGFRALGGLSYGGFSGPAVLILTETVEREYLAKISTGSLAGKFLTL